MQPNNTTLQPKVSIVIPVYKVEKYIGRCVQTLFSQTLDSLEYIFVDDCSPDDSIGVMTNILEEYPERKQQVKIIRHEENTGVGQSRQDGVDAATGEYIIHCDPDDWVEPDMYERLYEKAKETDADLVICDYYNNNGDLSEEIIQEMSDFDSISLMENITGVRANKLNGCLWNKLLRSKYSKEVKFVKHINIQEDDLFWMILLRKELRIDYVNRPLYHYRVFRQDSLMNNFSKKSIDDNYHSIIMVSELAKNSDRRYQACYKTWIGAWISYRAFPCKDISNSEFRQRFRNYYNYIDGSIEFNIIRKFMVRMSCIGLHSLALGAYQFLHNANHNIKKLM